MITGIQIIGVIFSLTMIYLSYTYYRRKSYSWKSFLVWTGLWLVFMVLIMLPESVYGVMQALEIERTADFFVMTGFLLYAVIIFYLYVNTKKTTRKMEEVVRSLALKKRKK